MPDRDVGVDNHAVMLVGKLEELIAQHNCEITANLANYNRPLDDVYGYFPKNVTDIAVWLIKRIGDDASGGPRKTIRLTYAERAEAAQQSAEEIFDRVKHHRRGH
jgi:hypothetical protein